MKKRYLFSLLIILFMIIGISNVNAATCEYTNNNRTIKFSTRKENASYKIVDWDTKALTGNSDNIYTYVTGELIKDDEECLNSLSVCTYNDSGHLFGYTVTYYAIFGSSLDTYTTDDPIANTFQPNNNLWHILWERESSDCKLYEYSGGSGGDRNTLKQKGKLISYCDKFVSLYNDVVLSYRAYDYCEKNNESNNAKLAGCKSKALSKVNRATDTLKSACKIILQNESLSAEDGCISSCLQATSLLNKLHDEHIGGGDSRGNTDCGFSKKLAGFIVNILKWIKYILPIVVIVLGILDFMKAIGSDKDTEMKKAQGKFIKRLIAAALVFIVPLIIVFILEKMGFVVEGCDIIDL